MTWHPDGLSTCSTKPERAGLGHAAGDPDEAKLAATTQVDGAVTEDIQAYESACLANKYVVEEKSVKVSTARCHSSQPEAIRQLQTPSHAGGFTGSFSFDNVSSSDASLTLFTLVTLLSLGRPTEQNFVEATANMLKLESLATSSSLSMVAAADNASKPVSSCTTRDMDMDNISGIGIDGVPGGGIGRGLGPFLETKEGGMLGGGDVPFGRLVGGGPGGGQGLWSFFDWVEGGRPPGGGD